MSQRVVADASVLIFLGKISRLSLLARLWKGPFYISGLVKDEVLPPSLTPEERGRLTEGLRLFKTASPRMAEASEGALSRSDWSVVHLALEVRAAIVLADEKAMRNVLSGLGLRTLGTLGCLLAAAEKRFISKSAAKDSVDALITHHRFHISAETYQMFLKLLAR